MTRGFAVMLLAYLVVSVFCYQAAFLLRFDFQFNTSCRQAFFHSLPFVLLARLLVISLSGEWQGDSRYYSLRDVLRFAAANAISVAGLLLLNAAGTLGTRLPVPSSVIAIDGTLQLAVFGMVRASPRLYREILCAAFSGRARQRTLIYGSGSEGVAILKSLQSSNRELQVVGIVSPGAASAGRIAGVAVHAEREGWPNLVKRLRATRILVPSDVPGRAIREITGHCAGLDVKIHVIPGVTDLTAGRYSLGMREITIADLLQRGSVPLETREIAEYLAERTLLVTGAAGSIGSELCRQLLGYRPASLILVDQSELGIFALEQEFEGRSPAATELHHLIADITDSEAMEQILARHRPEVIFHAAAYKHVPLMEKNVQAAVRNNVFGTRVLVDLAVANGVERFVLVSTDKAVRPTSIMGATKLVAEKYVQAAVASSRTRFITVRFGNVLNSTGSVIPTFRRQIENGGPVTVTHPEMRRFFMTIAEASQLVLRAGALGNSGDVLILDMGEPVKIVDLAKDMIRLSGLRYSEDIDIVFTGIRPGEKLHEELLDPSERGLERAHDKIFRASPTGADPSQVALDLTRLEKTLSQTPQETGRVLWQIVERHVDGAQQQPRYRVAA
jgi:FlaA1/EpsC-like NDP-sugar epimerase